MTAHFTDTGRIGNLFQRRWPANRPRSSARWPGLIAAGTTRDLFPRTALHRAQVGVVVFSHRRPDVIHGTGDVGEAGEVDGIDVGTSIPQGKCLQGFNQFVEASHRRRQQHPHGDGEGDDGAGLHGEQCRQPGGRIAVDNIERRSGADDADDDDPQDQDVPQLRHIGRALQHEIAKGKAGRTVTCVTRLQKSG